MHWYQIHWSDCFRLKERQELALGHLPETKTENVSSQGQWVTRHAEAGKSSERIPVLVESETMHGSYGCICHIIKKLYVQFLSYFFYHYQSLRLRVPYHQEAVCSVFIVFTVTCAMSSRSCMFSFYFYFLFIIISLFIYYFIHMFMIINK